MAAARVQIFPNPAHRVAIGIKRVSLLKQVGNYSFDGQGNKFALLEQRFGCTIPTELMIEDKGYSGTDFNRPSIKQALKQIRAGAANAVAFPWLDRFAREVEGGLATIRLFREAGADVLLGDLGWYQDSGWFKAQMNMFMTIAQYQKDDIADKSRWGVQAKLAKGFAHYGAPYGWHMVTALEIAARAIAAGQPAPIGKPQNYYERMIEQLEVVQLIGEMALAGGRDGSQRGICRELDARGIKPPIVHKVSAEKLRDRTIEWNAPAIHYIAWDDVYSTGLWHYGKRDFVAPDADNLRKPDAERHRVKSVGVMKDRNKWGGSIEMPGGAVWTPDEQLAIQEAIIRNGQIGVGRPAKPRAEGGREAVLKNLCTCGATVISGAGIGEECGMAIAPWHASRIKNDGTRTLYMRCTHRHRTKGHHECDARSVRADLLEDAVWDRVKLAVCEELDELIAGHFKAITTVEDQHTLEALRREHKDKQECRRDAMRKEVETRNPDDKQYYAGLVTRYEAEIAILDRRIHAAANDAGEPEQFDTATLQRQARKAFTATDPAKRRAILVDWIPNGGVRYAHGEAVITIRVCVNCKSAEHDTYNKHLLLTLKTKVAA